MDFGVGPVSMMSVVRPKTSKKLHWSYWPPSNRPPSRHALRPSVFSGALLAVNHCRCASFRWYHLAATRDNAEFRMGARFETGTGTAKNVVEGFVTDWPSCQLCPRPVLSWPLSAEAAGVTRRYQEPLAGPTSL
jgi:hypothetical protein